MMMSNEKDAQVEEESGGGAAAPLLDIYGSASSSLGATSVQTLVNIIVSICGTGLLGLPYAFRVTGWLAGFVGVLLAGILTYYCMLLLVQCKNRLEEEGDGHELGRIETYGDIGDKAFGEKGRFATELLIVVSHAGGAIAYLLFIGQNLYSLFSAVSSCTFIFMLVPLEIGLCCVRSLKVLSPFSALADVCNVLAMAFVIKQDVVQLQSFSGYKAAFNGLWSIPFASGVAVFCFDGFGMTLALERSMAQRRKFPCVLLQAFIGITIAYACFGLLGYLAYGDNTEDIITLNLPNHWSSAIVKVSVCIALAFTFPIMMHPVNEIAETKIKSSSWVQKRCSIIQGGDWLALYVARLLMVVAMAVLATVTPGFSVLISLMGSTVCAFLAFVLPSVFHLKLMGSTLGLWQTALDYIILFVGLVFAVYGTYAALTGHAMG